jgi:hypothetical protein
MGGASVERRPSLWELQVGSNAVQGGAIPDPSLLGPATAAGENYITSTYLHPYADPDPDTYSPSSPVQSNGPYHQTYNPASDPEFLRQVDRLAGLVPHADRTILAGYLRRAGQDVLAIGQYLEDEKNGTLRAY